MQKETRWGSFRDFLTWRAWVGAFFFGWLTLTSLEAFATSHKLGDGLFLVLFASIAARSFLAFRRKVRILIDFVEPNGA